MGRLLTPVHVFVIRCSASCAAVFPRLLGEARVEVERQCKFLSQDARPVVQLYSGVR